MIFRIVGLCIGLMLPCFSGFAQSNVSEGDTMETALERLGPPVGTIQLRDKTVLLYPQGEVEFRDELVSRVDLMTAEEFAADQARLREEREIWQADQARLRAARTAEGESIRREKITSSAFASLRAKDRLDFWRNFQSQYPEVEVTEELSAALASYDAEISELKMQQRIAELEARVAQAEREATQARLEAQRLRDEAAARERTNRYGLRYYYDGPTYAPRHYYRPPKVTIFSNRNGTHVIHSESPESKQTPRKWFRQNFPDQPGPVEAPTD